MTLLTLEMQVGEWATKNFPKALPHMPLLGIIEEVGELAHAHLKAEQGIRGTADEHYAAKADAIGDIMVFAAHYCVLNKIDLANAFDSYTEPPVDRWTDCHEPLLSVAAICGFLSSAHLSKSRSIDKGTWIGAMIFRLKDYCQMNGIDFDSAVERTWRDVQKRDWQKNKQDGN